jgi:hypothetical protein
LQPSNTRNVPLVIPFPNRQNQSGLLQQARALSNSARVSPPKPSPATPTLKTRSLSTRSLAPWSKSQPHVIRFTPSSRRHFSVPPESFNKRYPWTSTFIRFGFSAVLGVVLIVGTILVHDAFTYSERHVDRVPCNPLSLHPRKGGKKNLPILEVNLDDEEDEEKRVMKGKPRLVIVGGGWGVSQVSFLLISAVNDPHLCGPTPCDALPFRLRPRQVVSRST